MNFEGPLDLTYCETIQGFRDVMRFLYKNNIRNPVFIIQKKLYDVYKNNLSDVYARKLDVQLARTGEVILDGIKCIVKKEDDYLRCFVDGNQLTIVRKDFTNLQESPAVFVRLDKLRITRIKQLKKGELK